MENAAFGTGSNLLGGTGPLAEALARRGGVGGEEGIGAQVSPASAIYNPADQIRPDMPQGGGSPMTGMVAGAQPVQGSAPTAQPLVPQGHPTQEVIDLAQSTQSPGGESIVKSEAQKIIEALTGHLKHIQKSESVQNGV